MMEVEILKRFKKDLTRRVSPREKGENTSHYVDCPLCVEYCHEGIVSCNNCPFYRFKGDSRSYGCIEWITSVIGEYIKFNLSQDKISWRSRNRAVVMKQLRLLRKRGKELVKWI